MRAPAARNSPAMDERESLLDDLVAGLSDAGPSLVSVPAPVFAASRLSAAIEDFGFVLSTGEGEVVVALGAAATLPLSTSSAELERVLRAFVRAPSAIAPFATFAMPFDPSRSTSDAGAFVVPRVAYVCREGRAHLVAIGTRAEERVIRQSASALLDAADESVPRLACAVDRVIDSDAERYRESVESALSVIADSSVTKVVLARRVVAALRGSFSAASLLASLGRRSPSTHRFALVREGEIFLGATPERLLSARGGRVVTEALAGTKRRGLADELVSSAKDRAEQRWVEDSIRDALAPFVSELSVDPEPRPRELRDLVHLATMFEARLREGASALDVVRALHPTPAVGGVPRARAVELIAAAEPFDRGFYAAPIGWVDANGDADVVVALRCGRFMNERVELFAGAGIVAGSDAALELEETDLKLRALLSVLDGDAE